MLEGLYEKFTKYIKVYFAGGWRHFIKMSIKGIFWLAPIVAITLVILWLYGKIDNITGKMFHIVNLNPENFMFLWTILGVAILFLVTYAMGHFMETWFGEKLEKYFSKIPGYSIIKDIIGIFNSSKDGDKQVLVVLIKGFVGNRSGYNVGLMYSLKESIVKGHYTVSLNMSPLPNGGFMFEVPAEDIFVIKGATFDHNLQYLLSMGTKPLSEIIGIEVTEVGSKNLPNMVDYLNSNIKEA